MKVVFVDTAVDGHHMIYLKHIIQCVDSSIVILPDLSSIERVSNSKYFECNHIIQEGNIFTYIKWIMYVGNVARKEHADIIHFLSGDFLIRFFGSFFFLLPNVDKVITFHHFRYSYLRDYSRKRLFKKCTVGVVHTDNLLGTAITMGINNCVKISYPNFNLIKNKSVTCSKKIFNIPNDGTPVLSVLGGTRFDKGLDILLQSLCYVKEKYYIIIAGPEDYFKQDYILKQVQSYKESVFLYLKLLSEDDFIDALNASDYLLLPYRKVFDGASGPLTTAIMLGKCIIGPNHGSIGKLINDNHLGYVFESENIQDLAKTIEKSIKNRFEKDKEYLRFQSELNPEIFKRKYKQLYSEIIKGIEPEDMNI